MAYQYKAELSFFINNLFKFQSSIIGLNDHVCYECYDTSKDFLGNAFLLAPWIEIFKYFEDDNI